MKKTNFIEFTKLIKKTLVSFISIIVFVLLGVGLFTGFSWGALSLKDSAQKNMVQFHLNDIEATCKYGFSNKDIERLKEVDKSVIVSPFNYSYEICEYNGLSANVKIYQTTSDINQFQEINGVLPEKEDEIAVPVKFAQQYDLKIGDTISFKHNWYRTDHLLYSILYKDRKEVLNSSKECDMKYLNTDTFKITATVNTILSLCTNELTYGVSDETGSQIEAYFFVNECAFDKKSTPDYRGVWFYSNKLNEYKYDSEDYKKGCMDLINKYGELAYILGQEKYEQIAKLGVHKNHKVRSIKEAQNMLTKLGFGSYGKHINQYGVGKNIYNEITISGNTSITTLIGWAKYAMKIISVVLPHFKEIYLTEFIENNYLFKMKKEQNSRSIGFLFTLLEKEKDKCEITEYSIQQTSLEQIFNKFAEKQGKTKKAIKKAEPKIEVRITRELVSDFNN